MAAKVKKKMPVFYKIVLTVFLLAIIAILVGMILLYGVLARYENAQPKNVADRVFSEYYTGGDFKKLSEKCAETNSFESADAIASYLNEHYGNAELSCTSGASQGGEITYIVKADDVKISYFTLVEESDGRYAPGVFVAFGNYGRVNIEVPAGYKALINSQEVSDSLITQKDIPDPADEFLPEGTKGPTRSTYSVNSLMAAPTVTATAPDGSPAEVIADSANKNFTVLLNSDKQLESEYSEYAMNVAKEYSKMMEADSYWGAVSPYFDPDSDIYQNVYESAQTTIFVIDHSGYRFDDESIGSFYKYNDDVFSCRIKFTHVLTAGAQEYKDYFDSTLIFRKSGDTYKVCGMINHA